MTMVHNGASCMPPQLQQKCFAMQQDHNKYIIITYFLMQVHKAT